MITIATKYVYLAAAVIVAGAAAASIYSNWKIEAAEHAVQTAKRSAVIKAAEAALKEKEANEYKAKIEYLERQLAGLGAIAGRQDREIEVLGRNISAARADVRRAGSIGSIAANARELCEKLASLGHPCVDE